MAWSQVRRRLAGQRHRRSGLAVPVVAAGLVHVMERVGGRNGWREPARPNSGAGKERVVGRAVKIDQPVGTKDFVADLKAPEPVWRWSSHPLVVGDQIFSPVGGEKHLVVAFDRKTGETKWSALTPDVIGYAPPVIVAVGGKRQFIVGHSWPGNSYNPETGEKS